MAKKAKPGDPLHVQVEPVVPIYLKENKNIQILEATRSMLKRIFFFVISHGQKHRSWRVLFTWFQYVTVFGSNEAGVSNFGFCPLLNISTSTWYIRSTWYTVNGDIKPRTAVVGCRRSF